MWFTLYIIWTGQGVCSTAQTVFCYKFIDSTIKHIFIHGTFMVKCETSMGYSFYSKSQ